MRKKGIQEIVFKMNKKASIGEQIMDNVIYLLLAVIFLAGMYLFVSSQENGAAAWEEFYAKEISKVMNLAKPGDEIVLDVHKGTVIAKRNKVDMRSETFDFNNERKEVCVKFNRGKKSCYSYFNDVNVSSWKVELAVPDFNALIIKIAEEKQNAQ